MTFRDRIQPQLRDWYDASAGFDFEHLEEFVPKCNAAELANLREDPQVKAWDQMIPGPDGRTMRSRSLSRSMERPEA